MRKLVPFLIATSFFGGVLIVSGYRNESRLVERRIKNAQVETTALRGQMHNAYKKRGVLLRAWAEGSKFSKEAEFNSLLVENDGLDLLSQPEFDRFDWVQEQLNLKISRLLTDKKTAAKKPKDWESAEREVAAARAAYAKRAIEMNRADPLPAPIPVFKAEAALNPEPTKK